VGRIGPGVRVSASFHIFLVRMLPYTPRGLLPEDFL